MMKNEKKTKKQLIAELLELHRRNAELEKKLKLMDRFMNEVKDTSQALIEAPTDSVFLIDAKGIFLIVNEIAAKRLGKCADELIGLCGYDLVSCDVVKRRKPIIDQVFRSGKPHRFEDDRAGIWFDTVIYPISDGSTGKVTKVAIIARDITDRKKAEKQLRESNEFSESLIDSMHDGFSVLDNHGVHINVNKALCKMTGFSTEELIGVGPPHPYWPPENYEPIGKAFQKTLKGEFDDFELTFMRKNGERFPVIVSPSLINDKQGNAFSYFATVKDITEQKRAEKALRESEDAIRTFIDAHSSPAFLLEPDGTVVWCNDVVSRIQGIPHDKLIGTNNFDKMPPKVAAKRKEVLEKVLQTGKTVRFDDNMSHGVVYDSIVAPIVNEDGKVYRVAILTFDITERKRLEENLLQAQKMESVGQLAGGVAHDFNNLLTAIIGYGNLLKAEVSQNDRLMAYVNQVLNSAERAANLTRNLLAFSRRQMINPKPVNVNNIINNMKSFLPRIIGEDIDLSLLLTGKDLTVMADKHQIEQVLMNLATNARDAMPDGGKLTMRTEYREVDNEFIKKHGYGSTGSYAIISVEDTGQGMDEETKERLFDPFFTTKEVGKGTGLGLSMAYGIIKQHNGYIDVQSEYGKGTTFNIYLPLTKPPVEEDKKPEDLPILKGGNETILVAEDEKYVRDFMKEILTGYGYKVLEAIDGEDAIKVLNTHKDEIELFLIDVIMPKRDGKMVYKEIKKVSPHMKVIFISGYTTDILYKKGLIEEGLIFISKPMSPDELLIKVREVLDS